MLCSQFPEIFDNFRRKNWRLSQKQCNDQIFAQFSIVSGVKAPIFSLNFFGEKFFKTIT
jgi:hypothetical protein